MTPDPLAGTFDSAAEIYEQARRNLPGLDVHVGAFEDWDGEIEAFDLVYAATAWHWLDPGVRYARAHRLLRAGGHLAFWGAFHAFPAGFDPFFSEIQQAYDVIGESVEGEWPPPSPDEIPDERSEIEASGLFEGVRVRRYLWECSYDAGQYIALLDTFSGHLAMEAAKRDYLYGEIRARLARRPGGRVRRHWYAILHVARRRG